LRNAEFGFFGVVV